MRSRKSGAGTLLLLSAAVGAAVGLAGCAGTVGPWTESAVSASLRAVNQRANEEQIETLLTSREVERSTRALTRAVVDAALADLGSEERQERSKKLAADFVHDLGPVLGSMLGADVLPRVREEIEASVRKLLDQAFSEEGRRRTAVFVSGVARQAMETVAPAVRRAIADGVSAGIDRSLRTALAGNLSPALGKALDENAPAISRAMRAGTAGALQGVTDGMNGPFGAMLRSERRAAIQEAADAAAAERKVWFDKLDAELAESRRWFYTLVILAAVGGVLLLGMGLLLWRLLHENRRLRSGA